MQPTSAETEIVICAGSAKPDDVHLASKIICVDGEIIDWLAKREATKTLSTKVFGQRKEKQR